MMLKHHDPLKQIVQCSAAKCETFITGRAQKACTGCNTKSYCSQPCQSKDWPRHKEFCKIPATVFEDAARTFIQHTHHILLHNAVLDLGLFQLKQIGMSSELARQVWRKQTTRMGFVVNITFDIPDTSEHFLVEPPWFHARVGSFGGKCHLAAVQAETGRDVIGATTTRISNFTASNPECEGYCIVFRVPLGHGSSEHSVATICEYFDWAQLWSMKVKPASEVVAIVKRDLDEVIDRRRARALKEAGR